MQEVSPQKQIVVISGPTGSGESTVTNEIISRYPHRVVRLVTATTREPRHGEKNGVDYFFFTKEQFAAASAAGQMLEETYVANRDTHYGTYRPDLDEKLTQGYIVVANTDAVGTRFYKKEYNATGIFLLPGNMEEIPARLRSRNIDMSEDEITKRYENAVREVAEEQAFYDYTVVNGNGKLNEAVDEILSILKKEGYNI